MKKTKTIYFDMDGTLVDLYSVPGWLEKLRAYDATPYQVAKPLVNMNSLSRLIKSLQKKGYKIGILSCTSKKETNKFAKEIKRSKLEYLKKHLGSVEFDEIKIIPYTEEKYKFANNPTQDILFDDREEIRNLWKGKSHSEKNIIKNLKKLIYEDL